MRRRDFAVAAWLVLAGAAWTAGTHAAEPPEGALQRPKRLLLLGQSPDGHPAATHEYMPGVTLLARLLQPVEGLQTLVVKADDPWVDGPELLEGADGVVLFVSEGARWLQQDPPRLAAFQRLAERKGGLVVLHWGMGTKEAGPIKAFVDLFGGCHGGPDRKYQVVDVRADLATPEHPVVRGLAPFDVHEEFYYRLKLAPQTEKFVPLIRVPIDDETHTVAWAWERPDGGRSCGFSGGHFHENWRLPEYRRLMAQSLMWTLDLPIPAAGLPVDVQPADLALPLVQP